MLTFKIDVIALNATAMMLRFKCSAWTKKNEPPESEKKKQDEAEHQGR